MTVHHARVIALAGVLVGISVPLEIRAAMRDKTLDELRALADRGDAEAQVLLGWMYAFGQGVRQEDSEAVRRFRFAADQGDTYRQNCLGRIYQDGYGVAQDYVEAHLYFNLAAAQKSGVLSNRYIEDREAVARLMTRDQIAEAQRRAREWTPTPEP